MKLIIANSDAFYHKVIFQNIKSAIHIQHVESVHCFLDFKVRANFEQFDIAFVDYEILKGERDGVLEQLKSANPGIHIIGTSESVKEHIEALYKKGVDDNIFLHEFELSTKEMQKQN